MTPAPPDGFRPGEDIAPGELPALEPAALEFTEAADAGGTDLDVLMGYQLLLGRDPENSFVIADAKTSPVGAFIRALMGSGEFQSAVLDKLESGRPLPHEASAIGPTSRQVGWLLRHITVPSYAETMLRTAPTWRHFLRVLLAVPGVPRPPARAASPDVAPAIAASAADEGFVLIHLEQPKPGDALQPGTLVNGSGWTIAPADVTEVAVLLNDKILAHARYGLPRPDVARGFPHYRHVDHCGFAFTADIPGDTVVTDRSQLVVRVRTARGDEGMKALRLLPPKATEAANPVEPWPIRLAVDHVEVDDRRVVRLRGWAATRAGLDSVKITIGETGLAAAVTGLARPDIAQTYPDYGDAAQAGFALVHGLDDAFPAGPSFLRVQAQDRRGLSRQTIVPITVPPPVPAAAEDAPAEELETGRGDSGAAGISCGCDVASLCTDGRLAVSGWAVAEGGIDSILVELDGLAAGEVTRFLPRPDVGRHFADIAGAAQSGFSLAHVSPAPPGPGPHVLALRFNASHGGRRVLELPVRAVPPGQLPPEALSILRPYAPPLAPGTNASGPAASGTAGPAEGRGGAADMRLELDRPILDGDQARQVLRGALSISGWAIARSGIAGVSVYCDDSLLGEAHMGMRREDIGAAFSDYPGSLLAGYALVLPPGGLPEGRHQIRVEARAAPQGARQGDGPPSRTEIRFFLDVAPYDALPPGGEARAAMPAAERALGLALLEREKFRPCFEAVIGVTGAGVATLEALSATLVSLAAQAYPGWRARVFAPARLSAAAQKTLATMVRDADPKGRIVIGDTRFPASRRGAAKGPHFFAKLRPGDILGCDAWLECALEAANDRTADLIYSDELRLDPSQGREQPFFKPDWSPHLLLSTNFLGRLCCASAELAAAAGFSAATLAATTDYEQALRLSEQATRIAHVRRVLCRRGGTADSAADELAALEAALARRKIRGAVLPGAAPGIWRVRREPAKPRRAAPLATPLATRGITPGLVSIIIPTCGARGLVRTAIKTIRATTAPARAGGPEVEIILLDNTPAADAKTRTWLRRHADTVVDMPGPFNWSRFNNAGAAVARGEFLLFLNDDIEITQPDWLDALLEPARLAEVGVVGARLLYPDGKVQHAGQYLADGHARHAFRFADGASPGPFGLATVAREVISVTGACLMMQARVFKKLGGFEEAHSVVNNDLDFCLRSWQAGFSVIYTPHATLIHHELASRARLEDSFDEARFAGAWRRRFLAGDPFRNPHLGPESDHYGTEPEPAVHLHAGRRGPPIADVRRILALKLDHIGDFLTALPALRRLRETFPAADIDLLAPAATASLAMQAGLAAELGLSEVLVFDFFHARSGEGQKAVAAAELAALERLLGPKNYDIAIDLRMHPDTRPVLRHTGAACLAGYDHDDRFGWLDVVLEWEGDHRLVRKRAHISERLVQLVSATADACSEPVHRRPPGLPAATRGAALKSLPRAFLARPTVCVHPGVGNPVRQWPAASYAALIDLLNTEAGLNAVLIGSAEEATIAEDIMRRVAQPDSVESLVGRVKLAQLPAVMQACVLFVGNNSGPQHLAASLGVPTIGIHSGVVDAAEWAPLGGQALAIRRQMICSPCYLEFASDCPRDLACLTGLLPRDVFAACRRLLAGSVGVIPRS